MSLPAIIHLRNYRDYDTAPESNVRWMDHTAPQGKVFVAVVLGVENKDGSDPLPIIDFLRDLVIDGVAVIQPTPEPAA